MGTEHSETWTDTRNFLAAGSIEIYLLVRILLILSRSLIQKLDFSFEKVLQDERDVSVAIIRFSLCALAKRLQAPWQIDVEGVATQRSLLPVAIGPAEH